jgi:hypothetical protein
MSDDLRRIVRGSLSAAIGRFARRVRSVFVWLEDTNGPKGGAGIQCRMVLGLERGGRLMVSAEATNEYAAVGRAANRARHRLVRTIDKRRRGRRQPPAAASSA